MKTLKKTLCLVLAVVMVVGALVLPASATYDDNASIGAAYKDAVNMLDNLDVMEGDANGNFKPTGKIQRQEMAAIVYRLLTGDTAGYGKDKSAIYAPYAAKFTDVKSTDWAVGYIGYCANKGIIVGTNAAQTTFEPARAIPANDVLAMLLRAVGYGQNNEYTGPGWTKNIASDATRLGLTKGITSKLDAVSQRQEVAQMTYNAALNAPRVTYVNGNYSFVVDPWDPSSDETVSLIAKGTPDEKTADPDVWGIPGATTTKTTYTWTYPADTAKIEKTLEDTVTPPALYTGWDAITECDLVDAIGASDEVHYAKTYTNGAKNVNLWNDNVAYKGAMEFEPLDTVNKIGHEGRWFRVYKTPNFTGTPSATNPDYIFVFVDTYLGVVKSTWDQEVDPAGHVIRKAGANVDVYYNYTASTPAKSCVGEGSVATTTPLTLSIEGDFEVGDKIGVNMTNYGTGTKAYLDKNVTKAPASASDTACSTTRSKVTLKPVTAKVTSITTDTTAAGEHTVGFVADGVQYYYNYTFAGTVLDGSNVGQTYTLLLGHDNDVLAYQLADATSGYGVTQTAQVKQVNSNEYVVTYTILLPNGKTITLDVVNNDGKVFTKYEDAENYANGQSDGVAAGNLVHYTNAGKYYAFIDSEDNANRYEPTQDKVAVESGRAEAIDKKYDTEPVKGADDGTAETNFPLVNDNTVFFVANYVPNTATPGEKDDFRMTGYSIYTGFQNIPDLAIATGSKLPDDQGTDQSVTKLTIQAFVVDAAGKPVEVSGKTQYAKYVLVTMATKQTVPPAKIAVKDYAFLLTNDTFKQETDSSYIFGAIIEGKKTELRVALARGTEIKTSGLYTYSNNINLQGYSEVYLMDAGDTMANGHNNDMDAPYKADFMIDANKYLCANDVLTVSTNEVGDTFASGTLSYYTVASGCKVFLVNPTTGTSLERSLSYLDTTVYGKACDIWYQLDEFGRIDLIYIVENKTDGGGSKVEETASLKFDATPTANGATTTITPASDDMTAKGAAKASGAKVTAVVQKFTNDWVFFCNGTAADVDLSGGTGKVGNITTALTMEAGGYRVKITVKSGGETLESDWIYFSVTA